MRKIVAIGGMPGTGKSSIVRLILASQNSKEVKFGDLLYGYVMYPIKAAVFGIYTDVHETFPGTDKLSMAVQPKAQEYLSANPQVNVLFEGDRLFNRSFLQFCADLPSTELSAYLLTAPQETLVARYKERGSDQSEKFLNSRKTKYHNILSDMMLSDYVKERRNAMMKDQASIVEEICDELR